MNEEELIKIVTEECERANHVFVLRSCTVCNEVKE